MKKLIPIFLLLLASCELIVEVDVPYGKDKVVVNALQEPDSTWRVYLTKSNFILDPSYEFFQPVDEAVVVIEKPDGSSETLSHTINGEFRGTTYPKPGETYRVRVDPAGYEGVEAEMTMPFAVPIIDLKWDSSFVDPRTPGYASVDFEMTFTDPPGETFYDVQVYEYEVYTYSDENGEIKQDTLVRSVYVLIHDVGIASEEEPRHRFNDRTFEGRTYTGHFATRFSEAPGMPITKIEVRLVSMSKELFMYEETKDLSSDVMGDPFAQPVSVYSNLTNGFGIFAGSVPDRRTYSRQ